MVKIPKTYPKTLTLPNHLFLFTLSALRVWRDWSDWSACTTWCGPAIQIRSRECYPGNEAVKDCNVKEFNEEVRKCDNYPCKKGKRFMGVFI